MRTLTHRLGVLGAAAAVALAPALAAPAHAQTGPPHRAATSPAAAAAASDPIQVYGAWLCGSDQCTWATAPDMTTFDTQNHWLIDRGDGGPSVNLVVLSFVDPLKLLDGTTDAGDTNGVPDGMDQAVVNYFTGHGVRVMLSIGGITYTDDWNTALTQNATPLGQKAAALATQLGVGIEIDYEKSSSPNLTGTAGVHRRLPGRAPLRRHRREPGRAVDDRPGRRRPLADRAHPVRHRELADHERIQCSTTPTRWCRAGSRRPAAPSPTGSSTSTASPTTARRSARSLRRSSPAGLSSPGRARSCPSATTSPPRCRTRPAVGLQSRRPGRCGRYDTGMLGYMFWAAGAPVDPRADHVPAEHL